MEPWTQEWIFLLRILLAILLGFLIGLERKMRCKEAGIRTHAIVAGGACLIMIVSKYGFFDVGEYDASRVAAQIVSGIGFIGAGMILYKRQAVSGLTTAAGIWTTAGIGMAAGSGLYILAAGATVIIVAVQCLLHLPWRVFRARQYHSFRIRYVYTGEETERIKELFGVKTFLKLNVERSGEETMCTALLSTDRAFGEDRVSGILGEYDFIRSVEVAEDNI